MVEKTNIGNCQATVCDRYQVKINIKIRKNQDKYKASFRYTIQLLHLKYKLVDSKWKEYGEPQAD